MHILAVDFGTKRLGLAWADTTLGVVLPYGLVEEKNLEANIASVAKLVNEEKITQVVVGFPLGMKGEENKNTERVQKFVFELQKSTSAAVDYFDERFSSQQADAVGRGLPAGRQGVSRDEKSAMIILQSYIDKHKK